MYSRKRYQDGGQPQENPEMEMVQQILQAIQQLSPEAMQIVIEQIQQMSAGQAPQEQVPQEGQYIPPQRRGGRI
jgi:hypothetical protein